MSITKSIYEELVLESNDRKRTVDISTGTISIDYYEDIFSPTITAKIKVVNTGNTIVAEGGVDKQSIYNGLPLRGGERLLMKIAGNSSTNPGLNFSKNPDQYLYVSSITDLISETNQESFTLHLVSKEAITNETSRVIKKYSKRKISDTVRDILTQYLKTNRVGTISPTFNSYGFIGNLRKPFTVLVWLASKAVYEKSGNTSAGFLFYQTQDGFQFRSVDELINQPQRTTIDGRPVVYTYSQVNEAYDEENNKVNNNFKILNYVTEKNQNLIEKLRLGTYSSNRIFFNPLTGTITPPGKDVFRLEDYRGAKSSSLGSPIGTNNHFLPPLSDNDSKSLGDAPTRIITGIVDVGTMEPGISTEENGDPTEYQSQALMRYNILFTQTLSIIVPSNTNLRAGDVIECRFPKITQSKAKEYDTEISGLYMIKELCHHFDSNYSYTSMKLVRDTFGVKK